MIQGILWKKDHCFRIRNQFSEITNRLFSSFFFLRSLRSPLSRGHFVDGDNKLSTNFNLYHHRKIFPFAYTLISVYHQKRSWFRFVQTPSASFITRHVKTDVQTWQKFFFPSSISTNVAACLYRNEARQLIYNSNMLFRSCVPYLGMRISSCLDFRPHIGNFLIE